MDTPLVNRVAESGLITINLEDYYPTTPIVEIDLKDFLFMELVLKEKDFRLALKQLDWEKYRDKIVLVNCSADAIIPVWAFMLVSGYLGGVASESYIANRMEYLTFSYMTALENIDYSQFQEKRVVIKGCSEKVVPPSAYAFITQKLKNYAQSIMYGEPCSTVPIFKRPRLL